MQTGRKLPSFQRNLKSAAVTSSKYFKLIPNYGASHPSK
jgi:hypothetical protein